MKKYDYYRPSASSLGRKKKYRRTASVSFFKPLVFFLIFAILCFAAYAGVSKAYKAFSASRLGTWQADGATVSGADGELAKELQAAANKKRPGSGISAPGTIKTLYRGTTRLYALRVRSHSGSSKPAPW